MLFRSEKGMIRLIKAMYAGSTTAVKVQREGTESFEVKVGVHQGSVLSPLLFVMVMEALSRDCREGLPYELLYADDLVLMAESREGLAEKLRAWKKSLEAVCHKCVIGTQAGGVVEEREKLGIDVGQGGVVEGMNKFCYLGDRDWSRRGGGRCIGCWS